MTARRRRATATFLALVAVVALAGVAAAHAQLVASTPAPGEVLASAPSELRLTFSEPLEAGFSSADVVDAGGASIVSRAGEIDPADAYTLIVALPALEDGAYTVTWRSLSTADGHPGEGFYSFGVGDVELAGEVSGQDRSGADPSDPVGLAGKWIGYVAMLLGIGVPLFAAAVLRGEGRLRRRTVALLGWLLVVGGIALLALAIRVPLVDGDPIATYLVGSRGGVLALVRSAVLLGGGVLVVLLARRSTARALVAAAATALVGIALHVAGGHAAAAGSPVPVLVQLVHLVGAGVWLSGILLLAALAGRSAEVVDGGVPAMRTLVPRFSALALGSIGLIALTGLYAEWSQIGGLPSTADPYGRALILKLAVVVAALAVGLVNYLDGGRGRLGGIRPRLLTEAGLALGVLAATALLSTTPPAATRGIPLEPRPSAQGVIQRTLGLSIAPGRPGINQLAVDVQGNIGDLPLDLVLTSLETGSETRISLNGSSPGSEPIDHTAHSAATAQAPIEGYQRYVAGALVMPADTHWDASVVLGDGGDGELLRQRFTFSLGDAALDEGAAGSLADGALIAGLLLLLGGTLALGLGAGGLTLPRCDALASRVALLGGGTLAAVTGLAIGVGRLVGSG